MSYTAVADKLDRQTAVLDDRAVSARNYHGAKLLRRTSGDPIPFSYTHLDVYKRQGALPAELHPRGVSLRSVPGN